MLQTSRFRTIRENSLGYLIHMLSRRTERTMCDQLEGVELSLRQFANLMILADQDGINQRQLGEKLDDPDYATSRSLDALVEAGYVERRPDPKSRRSLLVFLTDKGRSKVSDLPAIVKEVNDFHFRNLSDDERQVLVRILQKAVGIGQPSEPVIPATSM